MGSGSSVTKPELSGLSAGSFWKCVDDVTEVRWKIRFYQRLGQDLNQCEHDTVSRAQIEELQRTWYIMQGGFVFRPWGHSTSVGDLDAFRHDYCDTEFKSGDIPIMVKLITCKTLYLSIKCSWPVWAIHWMIEDQEGIPADSQESTLHLVLRLRGGRCLAEALCQAFGIDRAAMREMVIQSPTARFLEREGELDEDHICLLPAADYLPAFRRDIAGWMTPDECPQPKLSTLYSIVWRYTCSGAPPLYLQANIALGIDYAPFLRKERDFIRQLQFCICVLPGYTDDAPLRRGMDLDPEEIQAMENMKEFYFPSFVSASTGEGFTGKNTKLIIDASEGERITLDIANSPHQQFMTPYAENEVLISCYSKFRFIRKEGPKVASPQNPRKVWLKLLDPYEEHADMKELYEDAKDGKWLKVFEAINNQPHKAQIMVRYFKPASGWTMLHQAAYWGNQDAVNTLMLLGARPDRVTKRGRGGAGLTAKQVQNKYGSAIDWELASKVAESFRDCNGR